MTMRLLSCARWTVVNGAIVLGAMTIGACDVKTELLQPQQPQVISPGDVTNSTGALGLYVGAVGRFKNAMNGGNVNQENLWSMDGLMTDEFRSGDTFSQRNDADQRRTQTNDQVWTSTYRTVQQARGYARKAI